MRAVPEEACPGRVQTVSPSEAATRRDAALADVEIASGPRRAAAKVPRRDWRITPTAAACGRSSVWRGLPQEIEARWAERFGTDAIGGLRSDFEEIVAALALADLPQWLTSHYGGYAGEKLEWTREPPAGDLGEWPLDLSALLSQVLQAFALAYEADSDA